MRGLRTLFGSGSPILDHVDPEGLIISRHGKPVAMLLPISQSGAENIGKLKDRLVIRGDIMSTGLVWNAES